MVYLIIETYEPRGGAFFVACTGKTTPAVFPNLEILAENLIVKQESQKLWKAANPIGNETARITAVAADALPSSLDTYPGKHATRPLNPQEKQRVAQLMPG